uniref:Uncharacterized protein n=1 Tax=Chromera velia CCMP2878 TaxID=1169474 RepID=A0A0G4I6H1_9ALVE|eukprot:Cvel_11412.t1-p1 / transcript=Cvel_11412.t1 / gene=Cvel_11412 / organism=Chromera_velia_CCMP2878 / gene_product=hypothetical protein / transcript_product=hypothetical protein / location=Cvel_scaffold717:14069-15787(-) / protein_length=573 / sequence_SO=supercontig / SO=protein_coding / is_pseudo=false
MQAGEMMEKEHGEPGQREPQGVARFTEVFESVLPFTVPTELLPLKCVSRSFRSSCERYSDLRTTSLSSICASRALLEWAQPSELVSSGHISSDRLLFLCAKEGSREALEWLIQQERFELPADGLPVNLASDTAAAALNGLSALRGAAEGGSIEKTQLLLKTLKLEGGDHSSSTLRSASEDYAVTEVVRLAACFGNVDLLRWMSEKAGVDVRGRLGTFEDPPRLPPPEGREFLLSSGAWTEADVASCASRWGDLEILRAVMDSGVLCPDAAVRAARGGRIDVLSWLIQEGERRDGRNEVGGEGATSSSSNSNSSRVNVVSGDSSVSVSKSTSVSKRELRIEIDRRVWEAAAMQTEESLAIETLQYLQKQAEKGIIPPCEDADSLFSVCIAQGHTSIAAEMCNRTGLLSDSALHGACTTAARGGQAKTLTFLKGMGVRATASSWEAALSQMKSEHRRWFHHCSLRSWSQKLAEREKVILILHSMHCPRPLSSFSTLKTLVVALHHSNLQSMLSDWTKSTSAGGMMPRSSLSSGSGLTASGGAGASLPSGVPSGGSRNQPARWLKEVPHSADTLRD